jgi:hypothetical protein
MKHSEPEENQVPEIESLPGAERIGEQIWQTPFPYQINYKDGRTEYFFNGKQYETRFAQTQAVHKYREEKK